jgi:L-threonylcarbamoyladenylate synthase
MNTEWICWDAEKGYQEEDLRRAVMILQRGGLVAFPTETVYGLGGNGMRPEAARRIYEAKGRPSDNPLILHISDREELAAIVDEIPERAEALMDAFWPGPMTLIFRKSKEVPYETTGGLDTVAVRMPEHEGARQLISRAGVPVAAPSANRSGRPSPTTAEHVREDLWGKIDMIVDGGPVGIGVESTIVDLTEEVPVILRPGHITKKMIEEVAGEVRMDPGLTEETPAVRPKAPGMKYRHYAPKAEMTVIEGSKEAVIQRITQLAEQYPSDKVGILATEETKDRYHHGQVISAGSRRKHTIEQGLYGALRAFDHREVEVIFSESFSQEDKSEAIMNRLLKAAGQRVVRTDGE